MQKNSQEIAKLEATYNKLIASGADPKDIIAKLYEIAKTSASRIEKAKEFFGYVYTKEEFENELSDAFNSCNMSKYGKLVREYKTNPFIQELFEKVPSSKGNAEEANKNIRDFGAAKLLIDVLNGDEIVSDSTFNGLFYAYAAEEGLKVAKEGVSDAIDFSKQKFLGFVNSINDKEEALSEVNWQETAGNAAATTQEQAAKAYNAASDYLNTLFGDSTNQSGELGQADIEDSSAEQGF